MIKNNMILFLTILNNKNLSLKVVFLFHSLEVLTVILNIIYEEMKWIKKTFGIKFQTIQFKELELKGFNFNAWNKICNFVTVINFY